jgi:DNA-binding FrmR family transcriptional regulator
MSSAVTARLRRIEGQVRGLVKMLDEDRYCIDVLHQMQAVKSALARAESELLKEHAAHCVADAIASGNKTAQREKVAGGPVRQTEAVGTL